MTMPSIAPKVAWAIKARRYLALGKRELLTEAIAEARGQTEIAAFLEVFADGNLSEIDRLSEELTPILQQAKRREEVLTVNLLYLDIRAGFADSYIHYPVEQQKQARELGIEACHQTIEIAQILNDKPCQATYSRFLANGLANSRQLREAEHFYIQALRLYRDLAEREPHIFKNYVAETLNGLGNVQTDLQNLADAEKSFIEALQIRVDLALQELLR